MTRLQFEPHQYAVTCDGQTIILLPKEFALLHFLYRNRHQVFSREDLLNKVWPQEEPVDRTVDDHVYRLRKKCKVWASAFTIDTVRGIGYRLVTIETESAPAPSLHDAELMNSMQMVYRKYHRFGQGRAMQVLSQQQKALGIELRPEHQLFTRVISGDFAAIFEDADHGQAGFRLYLALMTFSVLHEDHALSLQWAERILEQNLLPEHHHREVYILDILFHYLLNGHVEAALARLEQTHRIVEEHNMTGFVLPVAVLEIYLYMLAGLTERTEEQISKVEGLLTDAPYLRESSSFQVAKGIWCLYQGKKRDGALLIQEGLDTNLQSGFVPHLFLLVRQIRFFLEQHLSEPELQRKYAVLWNELCEQYQADVWEKKLHDKLSALLL